MQLKTNRKDSTPQLTKRMIAAAQYIDESYALAVRLLNDPSLKVDLRPRTIGRYKNVARRITPKELERYKKMKTKGGNGYLRWSHILNLARLDSAEIRMAALMEWQKSKDDEDSANALNRCINKRVQNRRGRNTLRNDRALTVAQRFTRKLEGLNQFITKVLDTDFSQLDADQKRMLQEQSRKTFEELGKILRLSNPKAQVRGRGQKRKLEKT